MRKAALFLFLFLPIAWSKIAIYANNFDVDCYSYTDALQSLRPETPLVLSAYLRDLGFDVDVITDTFDLNAYDAVVVLSCTELSTSDVENLLSFYQSGGGLLLDLRRDNPLAEELGIARFSEPLDSVNRRSFKTVYTEVINGVYLSGALTSSDGPMVTGNEHLFYVGNPIVAPSTYNSGMTTPTGDDVLVWRSDGGRIVVIGCLYCAGPLLLAELIDWVEDGVVDFPRFSVKRRVVPTTVQVGGLLSDEITLISDGIDRVEGEYAYNVGGEYCNFDLLSSDFPPPQPMGDKYYFTARFNFKAPDKPISCQLPPVLLHLYYEGQRRDVLVDPVPVDVVKGGSLPEKDENSFLPLLGVALLFLLISLAVYYHRTRPQRLLRAYRRYQRMLRNAKIRRMKGLLSEEAYKKMVAEYEEKLLEIETALEEMGITLSSSGSKGPGGSKSPRGSGKGRSVPEKKHRG